MQSKSKLLRMRPEHAVVLSSIALGLFVWIVDAVLDYLIFFEGGFWELLILDVPRHELYIRTVILFLCRVYGAAVSRVDGRLREEEQRVEHLNLVLRAVRGVNQLIVREKNRDRLLKRACEIFIETRGYHNAWSALLGESGGLVTTAEAGLGEDFLPLREQLESGQLAICGQ